MAGTLPPTLSALLRATAEGRERAWTAFLEEYSERILAVARSLGGDEDATMDGYVFVLERLQRDDFSRLRTFSSDFEVKFTTWLSVVAWRMCVDNYRSKYGRASSAVRGNPGHAERRRLVDLVAAKIDPSAIADTGDPDPLERLEKTERLQALQGVLIDCPSRDRMLLTLRFEEDLTAKEIARLMGFQTVFHVYRRLNKVLERLRTRLEGLGL